MSSGYKNDTRNAILTAAMFACIATPLLLAIANIAKDLYVSCQAVGFQEGMTPELFEVALHQATLGIGLSSGMFYVATLLLPGLRSRNEPGSRKDVSGTGR